MSRIRGTNTEPELVIRRGLWSAGIRYRLHMQTPGGRADVVIPRRKVALFIDGCFWHGCPEHYVRPRSRNDFWDAKLSENVDRDRRQTLRLEAEGWKVLRVWEHEVSENPEAVLARLIDCLSTRRFSRRRRLRVTRVTVVDPSTDLEERTLEDLRNPDDRITERRVRSTRKTGRVRGDRSDSPRG